MTPLSASLSAPSSLSSSERKELFRGTLRAVSRSFYLTLKFLPPSVQQPMALGYLLARLSDTVADSAASPVPERLGLLQQMEAVLDGEASAALFSERMAQLKAFVSDEGEQRLLEKTAALFVLYEGLGVEDRRDVRWVLGIIISGQRLDLERFQGATAGNIIALASAAELEDYTWRVAGCVGEFWTRVCFRHLPRYAILPLEEMLPLGIAFGKALQLINILRDAPADLRAGRCYFPREQLAPHLPESLLSDPAQGRAVVAHWEAQCEEWLEMTSRYLDALEPWRLRLACFLPWAIARRTLRLMRERPPLEQSERVKVSRAEVKRLLGWGMLVAFFPGVLHRVARRF